VTCTTATGATGHCTPGSTSNNCTCL
jgi:hypothetical protein